MKKPRNIAGGLIILIGLVLLAACNLTPQNTAGEPTLDVNALFTAAAVTVQAQLTQTAQAMPTSTETPTLLPSNTPELPTLPPLPGADNLAQTATISLTLQLPALATPTFTVGPRADKYEWVSNEPADGASVLTGAKFDIRWTIKNTGTTTWNTNYTFRYFSGDRFTEKDRYNFRGVVKPGESTVLIADAIAPSKPGEYYTWWKLVNDQGVNFGDVDLKIKVVKPGPTPTTDPTQKAISICCDNDPNNDGNICDNFDTSVCPAD